MKTRILIADDEEQIRKTLKRTFQARPLDYEVLSAADGSQALSMALSEAPDLILLDVSMPGKDGWRVLDELRGSPLTSMIPVIMVTGLSDVPCRVGGFNLGADDYVAKPFSIEELRARVRRLLCRVRRDIGANPLTRLPGSPAIEEEVSRRIREGKPFAFGYADIDRFKSYNDRYGFALGDWAIQETARLLSGALASVEEAFLGHIGGDDFVFMTSPAQAPAVAQKMATAFDRRVLDFYAEPDRARGFIEAKDREGRWRRWPLIRLSMGIVTNERRRLQHYARVVQVASEMKAFLKSTPERGLSRFAFDRRSA
ncbi:MAG: response regulator [Elusimicrobia bacterium]|nr:response regulator [Elusimicrobiota bacterium]